MTEVAAVADAPAVPAAIVANATPASETPAPVVEQSTPAGETPEKPAESSTEKDELAKLRRRTNTAYRKAAEWKAKYEYEMSQRQQQQTPNHSDPDEPKMENYSDLEEWKKDVAKHAVEKSRKDEEHKRRSESQKQFIEGLTSSWEEKVEKFRDSDSFEIPDLTPSDPMTIAVMEEDNGPQIVKDRIQNPAEGKRITALHPIAQAREIGKLSAKLAAEPAKPKNPSQAPAPISPLSGVAANADLGPSEKDDYKTWLKKRQKQVHGR